MCHVIDKVILHFRDLTLTCNKEQRESECDHKNGNEDKGGKHEVNRILYIIIQCGKIDTDNAHTIRGIVMEHRLLISVSHHIGISTLTLINGTTGICCEDILERYLYPVISQLVC